MKKKKKKEEKKFQQFLQTRLSVRNFTFAADHIINGEIYAFQWVERIFHPYLRTNCCRVIPRDRWNKWKYRKLAPFSLSLERGERGGKRLHPLESAPVACLADGKSRGIPIRDIAKCVTLRLIDKRNTRSTLNRGPFTLL